MDDIFVTHIFIFIKEYVYDNSLKVQLTLIHEVRSLRISITIRSLQKNE